jgi:hypothetical protein
MVFDGVAPDILTIQQVRGSGQIQAYADQMSTRFGYPVGTYQSIVAWDDPESWGATHNCNDPSAQTAKSKQTNGIIYNTRTLTYNSQAAYWSTGWLAPGVSYASGAGCDLYKSPGAYGSGQSSDDGGSLYKWKRTSAKAAKFTYKATGTTIGVATQHLAEGNKDNACSGDGKTGIGGSGIDYGSEASALLKGSTIRIMGMDANKPGISPSVLNSAYGVTSRGTSPTFSSNGDDTPTVKYDYLFTNGSVQASDRDYTINGTKSNHKALYAFINL